ncbi:MAG: Signal peptide protein [Verrucomicrobiales bacterium]|nr:Signal peptide protein [Verrucomicrobiales bacterium]
MRLWRNSKNTRKATAVALTLLLAGVAAARADFQGSTHLMPFDDETINYNKKEPSGAIAKLQERINQGKVSLKYEPGFGYVRSLLDELKVPKSSQMLVFSKTSLQRERISPRNPRAIFFNDDIYIGFIPGAPLVEISVADPKLGAVFYTLEQTKKDKPRFVRTDQCLECHASAKSMGVPGHLVRSFATDETGMVDVNSGTSLVDHRTPLAERWGGWYVTGKHGNQTHRGNLVGKEAFERQEKEPNYMGNLENLDPFIQTSDYVAPHSDIVALMVLEHQTHMHNFITRLNYEATIRIAEYGAVKYLNSPTESFLKYLLFVEEAPLTAPVSGTSSFAKEFAAKGPKDKKGR